ncbi:MAG: MGMT family protein [Alkalispirochaeta sp.]
MHIPPQSNPHHNHHRQNHDNPYPPPFNQPPSPLHQKNVAPFPSTVKNHLYFYPNTSFKERPLATTQTEAIAHTIAAIPYGTVATYGQIATLAGYPRSARQVARILHTLSRPRKLPWHRVVNRTGRISLPPTQGGDLQRILLEDEGIEFDLRGRIDLTRFGMTTPHTPNR